MSRIIFIAAMCLLSTQVLAAGWVSAKVAKVRIDQTGNGMVIFDQPIAGSLPSCQHSAYANALAFNTNTSAGKAIMAMVLAAKSTGDVVLAYGLGTCSIYGGWVEDWDYGAVQ